MGSNVPLSQTCSAPDDNGESYGDYGLSMVACCSVTRIGAITSTHDFKPPELMGRLPELASLVSADQAAQAHTDLLDLAIELWPYDLLARRAWDLRANLSIYDAAYVALAEHTDTTLVTLDERIAGAPDTRCVVATPTRSQAQTDRHPQRASGSRDVSGGPRAGSVPRTGGADRPVPGDG